MYTDLSGKVALITGGGRGIGRALAEAFARSGAAVAVIARTTNQIEEAATQIEAAGGRALAVAADVTSRDDIERVVAETEAVLGPVDILVNNAGAMENGARLWEAEPEDWQNTIAVNVFGPFLFSRTVLPNMVARRQGRIINLSSGASILPGGYTGFSAYGASKAALNRVTETLATEVKEYGVSVFAIHPGVIRTELLKRSLEPQLEAIAPGRGQRMWELDHSFDGPVNLCLQLASGAADALTGCYLTVHDDLSRLIEHATEVNENDLYRMRVGRLDD